jgi:hypothetical protein
MDPSLVIMNGKLYSVDQILSSKNVYRAAIIRNEEGKTTFSAYEYNKRWSKGHAEFWGIDPEYVSWEELGNIILFVELENFEYTVQLPIDSKELAMVIRSCRITPTGRINLGHMIGKISKVRIFRNDMSFDDFYEFYVNETEQLEVHVKKFNELIYSQKDKALSSFLDKYRYGEDIQKIYDKMSANSDEAIHNKEHPTFNVCLFTKSYPGILPSHNVISSIYHSIFNNTPMNCWHAGEPFSNNPIEIGTLKVYNKICNKPEIEKFSTELLNIIQDGRGTKEYYLLQYVFCSYWKYNLEGKHFRTIFDDIYDMIVKQELEFAFKNNGMLAKEDIIDFKSAGDVSPKTSKFVNETILPMIKQYTKDGALSRNCILYGVSDSGSIEPIYNLKSDQITAIQEMVNKSLTTEIIPLKIDAISIPYGEGTGKVLALMLIPLV